LGEFDKISIFNEAGTNVYNSEITNQKFYEISLLNFETGVYFIKLDGGNGCHISSFVKE
jgi:hypothetical protein